MITGHRTDPCCIRPRLKVQTGRKTVRSRLLVNVIVTHNPVTVHIQDVVLRRQNQPDRKQPILSVYYEALLEHLMII